MAIFVKPCFFFNWLFNPHRDGMDDDEEFEDHDVSA